MLTGCGVAAAVVAMAAVTGAVVVVVTARIGVANELDTRIQQRTPRLRPLAPSTPTPTCKGAGEL